ncbi:MAG: hypothetical protein WCK32_09170 [Chlorobiaceae bacterium]
MSDKQKASQGANPARPYQKRKDRADQPRQQYTNIPELVKELERFECEFLSYQGATPEPRVCVYGIASSIPYSRRSK